jgi:Xaa-Pro aminopeptidase
MILPREDRFQGAYLAPRDERLAWATGFSGSAGCALILPNRAVLCVDGRYILAASRQGSSALEVTEEAPERWLCRVQAEVEGPIGFDPWQVSLARLRRFQKASPSLTFQPLLDNPVDLLWTTRPPFQEPAVFPYEEAFSGASASDKVQQVLQKIGEVGAQAAFLTDSASIAWLLNLRSDLPFLPAFPAYALIQEGAPVCLFSDIASWPTQALFRTYALAEMREVLSNSSASTLCIDPQETPCGVCSLLKDLGKTVQEAHNPCQALKAIKNSVELQGFRDCHERDAIALIEFLAWLEKAAVSEPLNEQKAAERLQDFRARDPWYRGPSFETISATGAQAAFVHYQTPPTGGALLKAGDLYLVDSGGQYQNGSTDCTRTVAIASGQKPFTKEVYTAVLQGLIAATTTIFPEAVSGAALDAIARRPLWSLGLAYAHGTGHGVGHYLGVHEHPPSLSASSSTPLEAGMVLSIEPGFYKPDAFGIRLENLVEVVPVPDKPGFLTFSTLTLVPFEKTLIASHQLTNGERAWLEAYHARIWETLHTRLSPEAQFWLKARL